MHESHKINFCKTLLLVLYISLITGFFFNENLLNMFKNLLLVSTSLFSGSLFSSAFSYDEFLNDGCLNELINFIKVLELLC